MANEYQNGDQYLKSRLPADNNYGQNAATHSSSTRPGENVSSNFLPELRAKGGVADRTAANVQTNPNRPLGTIPTHNGMRNRNAESTSSIPPNGRPVKR
jgi:hypothetical protein